MTVRDASARQEAAHRDVIGCGSEDVPRWNGRHAGRLSPLQGPRLVAAGALLALLAGVLATTRLAPDDAPAPAHPQLSVVVDGGPPAGSGRSVTGELRLRLVNRSSRAAVVQGLALTAPGLEVLSVRPPVGEPVPAGGERRHVVGYRVRDCEALRLPGTLQVSVAGGPEVARPVGRTPVAGDAGAFVPCTVASVPAPQLAVRPIAATAARSGAGADGAVRLEVRNGGPALRLLSVTAEVPGVRFSTLVPPHGVVLRPDERLEMVLGFEIDDCRQLRRTGRLVMRAARDGIERELGLTITHDREAGTLRQVALDAVLGACP